MSGIDSQTLEGSGGKPWGLWQTLALSLALAFVWLLIQVAVTSVFSRISATGRTKTESAGSPGGQALTPFENGTFLAASVLSTALVLTPLCVLCAALKRGISWKRYLALRVVPIRQLAIWTGLGLFVAAAADTVTWLLGRPVVTEIMIHAYHSVVFEPLLWIAVAVAAPVWEEFFFRGFLLAGIQQSRLGNVGAVVLTSVAWSALHAQYDLFGITVIFVLGLTFGYARVRTRSLLVPLAMHVVTDLLATIETVVYVHFAS